jgi:hypothetical protein
LVEGQRAVLDEGQRAVLVEGQRAALVEGQRAVLVEGPRAAQRILSPHLDYMNPIDNMNLCATRDRAIVKCGQANIRSELPRDHEESVDSVEGRVEEIV